MIPAPSKILIAGAGALGSMYGGFLRVAGHEVTLLGRKAHLDAVARNGLAIDGIFGRHHAGGFALATSPADVSGTFDLVVVAVKAYDTEAIARPLAGALAPGGGVLSLQNGLGNLETLALHFPRETLLGAPVLIGATLPEPGRVTVTVYAKPVKIGALPGEPPDAARRHATMLAEAGIPSEPTDRLFAFLWEKVLYNAPLNPLGAILRLPYGALAEHRESREVMDEIIREGFHVARADGVDLLWRSEEECLRHFYETLLPPTARHRSSMLQDIERGRRTEIDALNGYIVRRGESLGVPTPANATAAALVRLLEARPAAVPSGPAGRGRSR